MRKGGLEPPRPHGHQILNLARLPNSATFAQRPLMNFLCTDLQFLMFQGTQGPFGLKDSRNARPPSVDGRSRSYHSCSVRPSINLPYRLRSSFGKGNMNRKNQTMFLPELKFNEKPWQYPREIQSCRKKCGMLNLVSRVPTRQRGIWLRYQEFFPGGMTWGNRSGRRVIFCLGEMSGHGAVW